MEEHTEQNEKAIGKSALIILIGLFVAGIITFIILQFYSSKQEEKQLTINDITEMTEGLEFGIESYRKIMDNHDTELIHEGLFSLDVSEVEILEIDPYYWDEYRGYEYNQNTNYAIYRLTDGYYIIIYETDTDQQLVLYANGWGTENFNLTLSIYQKKEKKAKLIQEYLKTDDIPRKKEILSEIKIHNEDLKELNKKVLQTMK